MNHMMTNMRITRGPTKILAVTALAVLALAVGPNQVLATPIPITSGILNLGNFSVAVSNTPCIDFFNTGTGGTCGTPATVSVNAPVDPVLGTVGVTTGTIKDFTTTFSVPAEIVLAGTAANPAGATFDSVSNVTPSSPICPANPPAPSSCVIPGSPFVFQQATLNPNSASVTLTLNMCGYVTGTSAGTNCSTGTPYVATFTAQFTGSGATIPQLVGIIAGGGVVNDSISATLQPSTPEPVSFVLFGSGLIGLALVGRRFRRN